MTPLHQVGQWVREMLLRIPLPVVRAIFLAVPILLLVWVLSLPRSETRSPEGTGGWSGDLKVMAAVALLLQVVVYSLL
ncbi:MAG: hypothetical protein A2W31_11910 [Planctomycetes bacterium RBG_16_64_10]|nr:MAG: hypothetical protein A2W31_11910 [Planctomycetes bacterium RBG_16_64_10]